MQSDVIRANNAEDSPCEQCGPAGCPCPEGPVVAAEPGRRRGQCACGDYGPFKMQPEVIRAIHAEGSPYVWCAAAGSVPACRSPRRPRALQSTARKSVGGVLLPECQRRAALPWSTTRIALMALIALPSPPFAVLTRSRAAGPSAAAARAPPPARPSRRTTPEAIRAVDPIREVIGAIHAEDSLCCVTDEPSESESVPPPPPPPPPLWFAGPAEPRGELPVGRTRKVRLS